MEAGFYYIEFTKTTTHEKEGRQIEITINDFNNSNTNDFNIFRRGNGWYEAEMVCYGVLNSIIDPESIKYMYKPSTVLPPDYFKNFIDFVYMHFDEPKNAINKMVGWFGRS